jgi:hypothetical protein
MHTCHEVSVLYSGCGVCVITRGGALFCLHKKSMTSKLQSYITFPNSPQPNLAFPQNQPSHPHYRFMVPTHTCHTISSSFSMCYKTILIPISQTHIMHTLHTCIPLFPIIHFFSYLLFPLLLS